MKPHPRIRKTLKWGGAAVSVLLLVVWVGSGWWSAGAWREVGTGVSVVAGEVVVTYCDTFDRFDPSVHFRCQKTRQNMRWWFGGRMSSGTWVLLVPVWSIAIPSLLATIAASRLDTLARRARLNLCPKCGYDRTGLPQGAVCPECGPPARSMNLLYY